MKLNYRFYDKEDFQGRIITYEYDAPFHKNMDEEMRSIYGEELTFVKELNHKDRIIRLHSGYDSGKGTKYVAPIPRKKAKQCLRLKIRDILLEKPKHSNYVLELENEDGKTIHLMFDEGRRHIHIFTESNVSENGQVTGYRYVIDYIEQRLCLYLKDKNFYPDNHLYLEFNTK